jgi:hypothetical protein
VVTSVPALDSGRNPFELFLLGFGLLAGLPLLFGAPPPRSTAHLLSPFLVHFWAGFLVVGCSVALVGVWWRWLGRLFRFNARISTSLALEQFGLVSVGVGTTIYGIGIISTNVPGTGVAVWFVFAYAVAAFWRTTQIQLWVRAAIREQDR